MKKIMNGADQVENEMILGMAKAYPQYVRRLDGQHVVVRSCKKEGKVALISGDKQLHQRSRAGPVDQHRCLMARIIEISQNLFHQHILGDNDHGINMAKGFTEVKKKLPSLKGQDLGSIFKTVGMTLVSTVGGSSGPLYGTAFMKNQEPRLPLHFLSSHYLPPHALNAGVSAFAHGDHALYGSGGRKAGI